jgi:NAD(P)-dependent dehydrogenase (short-subunit alcohol dehydrogenase family)
VSENTNVVVVTGATQGIGHATAKQLATRGYRVIVTGRTASKAEAAARDIGPTARGMPLDLTSFESIRAFAEKLLAEEPALHALVNNAGMMGLDEERRATPEGVELTLATNVYGPFLLTHLLLERLRASAPARVVNVGSRVHLPGSAMKGEVHWDWDDPMSERAYDPIVVYKNSKLATMWFTYGLDRRLAGSGVTVNAVCPGFVPATLAEHKEGLSKLLFKHVMPHFPGAHTTEQAAANTVFAVTDPRYGARSGAFIGEEAEVAASDDARDSAQEARFWDLAKRITGVG